MKLIKEDILEERVDLNEDDSQVTVVTAEYTDSGVLICPESWEDGWRDK